jgi:hypothetical protein
MLALPLQDLRLFDKALSRISLKPFLRMLALPLQDLRPFDQALQVAMAAIIHLELFVTVYAVSGLLHPTCHTSAPQQYTRAQLKGHTHAMCMRDGQFCGLAAAAAGAAPAAATLLSSIVGLVCSWPYAIANTIANHLISH